MTNLKEYRGLNERRIYRQSIGDQIVKNLLMEIDEIRDQVENISTETDVQEPLQFLTAQLETFKRSFKKLRLK